MILPDALPVSLSPWPGIAAVIRAVSIAVKVADPSVAWPATVGTRASAWSRPPNGRASMTEKHDRVAVGRPAEGDVAQRHRARLELAELPLALRLDLQGRECPPGLGVRGQRPRDRRRVRRRGDQATSAARSQPVTSSVPWKAWGASRSSPHVRGQGLAVEPGGEVVDIEPAVLEVEAKRDPVEHRAVVGDVDALGRPLDAPRLGLSRPGEVGLGPRRSA